jgi:hypothetical protein
VNHKPECNEKWEYDKDHCICNWIEKAEQRILKLLEDRIISMSAHHSRLDEQEGLIRAIALIKGENK